MSDNQSVLMKVWRPETDTIERVYTIAGNYDDLGNQVAEGRLEKSAFWETLYRTTLRDLNFVADRRSKQIAALQDKIAKLEAAA